MSVNFKQAIINIRGWLNSLKNHRHDNLYEKKDSFLAENYLINGDKTVSQRGDFTTAVPAVSGEIYIDRYYPAFLNVGVNFSCGVPSDDKLGVKSVYLYVTSGGTGYLHLVQKMLNSEKAIGKVLTFSAMVKSSMPVSLQVNDDGILFKSEESKGNGEPELLKVTVNKKNTAVGAILAPFITNRYNSSPDTAMAIGDYIEIGEQKVEIGNKFTGFDYVLPAIQLEKCRRSMLSLTSDGAFDIVGIFIATSTTNLQCSFFLTPMDDDNGITLVGSSILLAFIGPAPGTITAGSLAIDTALTDMSLGKLVLNITGTGFTVGQMIAVNKSNDTALIYLESTE